MSLWFKIVVVLGDPWGGGEEIKLKHEILKYLLVLVMNNFKDFLRNEFYFVL